MTARSGGRRAVVIAVGLALAVAAAFGQTASFRFIDLDDRYYVADNPNLQAPVDGGTLAWAFTTFRGGNWHPLTWLSLMADQAWGGGRPAAFHVTNVLLHLASTLLLFRLLSVLTGEIGASGFVALLFGIHPLHVESVAWVVERKDTLSTAFGLAALLAWVRWVGAPSRGRYAEALVLFAASLMSKPMFVTLPLLLIAMDAWPLARFEPKASVVEKVPLFVLSAAGALTAIAAQHAEGGVASFARFSPGVRLANAVVSAAAYLGKTVWPARLAIPYPLDPASLTAVKVGAALALLLAIAGIAWRTRASHPWIAFGATWYAIALLPVAGLVQVGSQAMADRYTYVPLIGPFVAGTWEAMFWLRQRPAVWAPVCAALVAVPLMIVTFHQTALWRDSETLFTHVVAVTENNTQAHIVLSAAHSAAGRFDEALAQAQEAIRLSPRSDDAHACAAAALARSGRNAEAAEEYEKALAILPGKPSRLAGLGNVEVRLDRLDAAEGHLRAAIALEPRDASARKSLGVVLAKTGRLDEATREFEEVVRLNPSDAGARANLERARGMRREAGNAAPPLTGK